MTNRMKMLEDAYQQITAYTATSPYRPGLVDLILFDVLLTMHESNDEDENPEYVWRNTPDEIMEHILDSSAQFTIEYGLEDLDEQVTQYLEDNNFVVSADSVSNEEYTTYLEKRK